MNWNEMLGDGYFQAVKDRLYDRREPLVWPQQVSKIVLPHDFSGKKVLIEAGCCVGAAYKTFRQRYVRDSLKYIGLDFTPRYLEEAKTYFVRDIELGNCEFILHDIIDPFPVTGDYVVCSACLEHILSFEDALENLIEATEEHLVIRTFLGENYEWFASDVGLPIQQFSFKSLLGTLDEEFIVRVHRDWYTDSIPQLVQGAVRMFYVVSAKRR